MRLRKILLSLLLATILVLQSISLGWSIASSASVPTAVSALHTAFALYALVLALRAVNHTYAAHATAIIHLSALTFTAATLLFVTAILPSSPFPLSGVPSPSSLIWGSLAATGVQDGTGRIARGFKDAGQGK